MAHSMTGFASESGSNSGFSWTVEIRSVNAKGLDVRVRAPERMVGLDQKLKALVQKAISRGNVNLSCRYEAQDGAAAAGLNRATLGAHLGLLNEVAGHLEHNKFEVAPVNPVDILNLRGVVVTGEGAEATPDEAAILESAKAALASFVAMRASEGSALAEVLRKTLDEVRALVDQAAQIAENRKAEMAETLKTNLARVLDNSDGADPDRVAQELALLSVKADVTEEIDRLSAHVEAATALLSEGGAIGRKLDFLMQEFNREANTLCSKSGSVELTRVGLDLKLLIDQMREQAQNVE